MKKLLLSIALLTTPASSQEYKIANATCFEFNLTINAPIDDETKKIIRDFLNEAADKIKEGCRLVFPPPSQSDPAPATPSEPH